MTDHELFLTASYAGGLLCLLAEALWVRAQHRRALAQVREAAEDLA